MSLSLIITDSSSVGLRLCFFADEETAPAMRWHCDGVQAGVCHRIFCFTEQIVFARQVSASWAEWSSVIAGAATSAVTVVSAVPVEVTTAGWLDPLAGIGGATSALCDATGKASAPV